MITLFKAPIRDSGIRLPVVLFFLLPLCLSFATSCKKNETKDAGTVKLTFESNIGDLHYEAGRLTRVGSYELLYTDGILTGARREKRDTFNLGAPWNLADVYHTIEKYSFGYDRRSFSTLMIDTFSQQHMRDGQLISENVIANQIHSLYYFSDNRLDSVVYRSTLGNISEVQKIWNEFDNKGNIARQKVFYFPASYPGDPSPPKLQPIMTESSFEYDDQQNPYIRLFQQTGVILPVSIHVIGYPPANENGMINTRLSHLSTNNPVRNKTFITFTGGVTREFDLYYDYNYNSKGLPVWISTRDQNMEIELRYR